MQTTIFRNPEKLEISEVIDVFKDSLQSSKEFSTSEIEQLAEIYAKNPVDKFIVTEELRNDGAQGDIMIIAEHTDLYKSEIKNVKNLEKTDRLVLQEGDSFTGDHRIIPLEGTNYTVQKGTFCPSFLKGKADWRDPQVPAVLFETDKPFLVFHREHGNIALPKGKYMFCSQLDPDTLSRMMD